ncbi:MAG: hypothetical protein R3305_12285, partial [Gammaproteobacteria bacterium]|nr:hypothetical protein [Gammaproteobacteria bacterium]
MNARSAQRLGTALAPAFGIGLWLEAASAQDVAAPTAAAQDTAVEDTTDQETAETLDLNALESGGATIGRINLQIDNVFDLSDPAEDKPLYRWANRVHVKTRPSVVEDILLFEQGEPLSAQLLEESARLLRRRRFVA